MRKFLLIASLVSVPVLLVGCSSHNPPSAGRPTHPAAAHAGQLPTGPGPLKTYSVQPQPAAGSCHFGTSASHQPLPDRNCTPGALNPKVTQDTLGSTICAHGYTSTIRPPANITRQEKQADAKSYDYTGNMQDAEYDHLISLELGGDPDDPRNLWVEPPSPDHKPGAGPNNPKDTVENRLHTLVCSGKTSLADAQNAIASDWTTALATVGHPDGK